MKIPKEPANDCTDKNSHNIDTELQPELARDAFNGLTHLIGSMDQNEMISVRELSALLQLIEQAGCCCDAPG